jgi:hypothetical protein
VYVVGPGAGPDLDEAIDRSIGEGAEVVLVCIGRRLSDDQRDLVGRVLRTSSGTRFDIDAEWVPFVDSLGSVVGASDVVSIFVEGRDRERVDRALSGRRSSRWPG